MKLRFIAMTGVMSLAGLGLVGAGAHAIFTTSTTSTQNITAGPLSVVLYGPTGNNWGGNGTTSLTLPAVVAASSFTTGDQVVTMYNNGAIPASEITEAIGTNYPASALAAELFVCETSFGQGGSPQYVIYNGPLSGGLSTQAIAGTIAVGGTDTYTINVYAGTEPTACGPLTTIGSIAAGGTSTAPTLDNSVEGESLNVTVTVGYSG
jgi:hypothetical protein